MTSFVLDRKKQQEADEKARREQIAVAAMQGLLAMEPMATPFAERDLVRTAVRMADMLIAELDEDKP